MLRQDKINCEISGTVANLNRKTISYWLREGNEDKLEQLWQWADDTRSVHVGSDVHLRGLIEISNVCVRQCGYCGIRADNGRITRYRMTGEEIMACVHEGVAYRYGTVVLQAGEDYGITREWMAGLIRRIKSETELAVTLSLGERSDEDLAAWKEAGADRYLIRFETSNRILYDRIYPPLSGEKSDRIAILKRLREIGYEIGSGVMIGILGQTFGDMAEDILTFKALNLDMIGVGPYLPHPDTPLGWDFGDRNVMAEDQVSNSELMTYKVVALSRIVCPEANIPSTSALATVNHENGRELGLSRGANVVMPNLTPPSYRILYEIYPDKACIYETSVACQQCITQRILSMGRNLGTGPGGRSRRHAETPSDSPGDPSDCRQRFH